MKNYSRQREAILEVLRCTRTHPTAEWIYRETRKKIPNISLGTVYRNLSELSKSGEILTVNVGDGKEHYDGDISPHLHLHCKICGSITDAGLKSDPFADIAESEEFTVQTPVYVVYGCCRECRKQKQNL